MFQETGTGKYRKTEIPESVSVPGIHYRTPLAEEMVEQLLPGLLSVVHTALVHVQNEVGPGEPRPHIVGKHWSFPCGHAHGHIMEPHLALVFHKLAALSAGLALILALIAWFWTDHTKPDFVPCFWGSIGVIVASILIRAFAEWILKRPTRAERRATKRAAAQETGRVTMRMPVSEEVAAAFESTRDGRRASL